MRKTVAKVLLIFLLLLTLTPVAMAAGLGDRTLEAGSTGDDVAQLQQKLNTVGFWSGYVDEIFGYETKAAVENFQSSKGLWTDGVAGPETFRALNVNTSYEGTTGNFSQSDIELLAKLVYAEARGEPYTGKVAVAATVLNRLKDPKYPNTISGVIYQVVDGYYQYSPVQDGQINLTPDETARRAAMDAIAGYDPTGGATIFFNPGKTGDLWVRSKAYITTIGNHIFSK